MRPGNRDHQPARGIAAAGKSPTTRDAETVGHGLRLAAGRVQAAGKKRVRPGGEELLLRLLGKVPEPPVVHRPERVAPARRAAAASQLPADLVGRVDVDAVAAVAIRVADSDETGGDEVVDRFARNLPELFDP